MVSSYSHHPFGFTNRRENLSPACFSGGSTDLCRCHRNPVLFTRNIYAGFVAIILLFLIQIISQNALNGSPLLMCLLDPLAENAVKFETKNWTLKKFLIRDFYYV